MRRCIECGFLWVPQGVALTEAGVSIYEDATPVFLLDGNEDYYLDDSNILNARAKLDWVLASSSPGESLLDVGANFGHFLSVARERFEACGIEPSPLAVRWAKENLRVTIEVGAIDDLPERPRRSYDVLTMWDVIEHLPDPRRALDAARGILKPGGRIYLSTPDRGSLVGRLMGRRWHYVEPIQHIALFNRSNLGRLLKEARFRVTGLRTFGHLYRVAYVRQRLRYLYGRGPLRPLVSLACLPLMPFAGRHVTINLRDVMGVLAEAVE